MRMGLEAIVLPVSDVDRAKAFYERMGFNCDVDEVMGEMRVVQFTPPGSDCSVIFGVGIGGASESPVVGLHLVVKDLAPAVEKLRQGGVDVEDPFFYGPEGPTPGIDPNHPDYGSYAVIKDPDENVWLLQEVPSRAE